MQIIVTKMWETNEGSSWFFSLIVLNPLPNFKNQLIIVQDWPNKTKNFSVDAFAAWRSPGWITLTYNKGNNGEKKCIVLEEKRNLKREIFHETVERVRRASFAIRHPPSARFTGRRTRIEMDNKSDPKQREKIKKMFSWSDGLTA